MVRDVQGVCPQARGQRAVGVRERHLASLLGVRAVKSSILDLLGVQAVKSSILERNRFRIGDAPAS
jgi:hypothetical protein